MYKVVHDDWQTCGWYSTHLEGLLQEWVCVCSCRFDAGVVVVAIVGHLSEQVLASVFIFLRPLRLLRSDFKHDNTQPNLLSLLLISTVML